MEILDQKRMVVYRIKENKFIRSSGKVDMEISSRPIMGYIISGVDDGTITLATIFGKSGVIDLTGDDISIRWNEKEKIFEMLKF